MKTLADCWRSWTWISQSDNKNSKMRCNSSLTNWEIRMGNFKNCEPSIVHSWIIINRSRTSCPNTCRKQRETDPYFRKISPLCKPVYRTKTTGSKTSCSKIRKLLNNSDWSYNKAKTLLRKSSCNNKLIDWQHRTVHWSRAWRKYRTIWIISNFNIRSWKGNLN